MHDCFSLGMQHSVQCMHILKRTLVTRGVLSVEHLIRPLPAFKIYRNRKTAFNAQTFVDMCVVTAILSFLKKNYHFHKPISATLI